MTQSTMSAILAAIGEVVAACKQATGEDERIDREVGPLLVGIAERLAANAEPMELPLCGSSRYVLRIGQPYVFRPMPGCATCTKMAAEALAAYGDKRRVE